MLTIDGIDDTEEMKMTDEAMDILGFSPVCIFKNKFEKYYCGIENHRRRRSTCTDVQQLLCILAILNGNNDHVKNRPRQKPQKTAKK
jgi:hypothetical protein